MNARTLLVLCAVGATFAAASAATIELTKSSDNGFTQAYGWASGKAPEAGNDYLVARGLTLRGDNSQPFAGDSLQFGVVGGTEGVFFKEHTGTHTFTKLILANGYYRTWMSNNGQAAHIAGAVEVTSPASAPFRIYSTHNSGSAWFVTYWDAAFTGAVGTGLVLGPHPSAVNATPEIVFTGDNSAYLGSLSVIGAKTVFGFTTGNSLGGALATLKSDALSISDNAMLDSRGANVTLSASLNRGISVAASGARLMVSNGKSLRLEWPVSGSGTLKKTAAGTLTLASSFGVPLDVSNGFVVFADGFSGSAGVSVDAGAEISVAAGDEVEVPNLAFAGGALRIAYDETSGESGVLVLGGECTGWPIPVYPMAPRGVTAPFLKVPLSMKTVTADDFVKPADFAETGLPSATFTVTTEGDYQIVSVKTADLVTAIDTPVYFKYEGVKWSDGKTPHSGADYQVGSDKKLLTQDLPADYTFKGESLHFVGVKDHKATWEFNTGLDRFTADLRAGAYVCVRPKAGTGTEFHLCGRLFLNMASSIDSDNGLDFRGIQNNLTMFIDSVVSGDGRLSFQPSTANYTNTYVFTANNTYAGTYFVFGGSSKAEALTVLKFAKAESWGANPLTSKESGLQLQGRTELYPAGSQIVNFPNRQVKFYSTGTRVRVDEGEVFDLRSPVKFNNGSSAQYVANVTKIGGGTWAVGGSVTTDRNGLSDWPRLTVEEGFIRADNPTAFRNIAVTVGEGAGVAAKYRPDEVSDVATYGMIVTNSSRFVVSGDTLKFKIFTEGQKVRASDKIAVLTVPSAAASAIDAKSISIEHDNPGEGSPAVVREDVTYSSKPYIRYSCKFERGFLIFIK